MQEYRDMDMPVEEALRTLCPNIDFSSPEPRNELLEIANLPINTGDGGGLRYIAGHYHISLKEAIWEFIALGLHCLSPEPNTSLAALGVALVKLKSILRTLNPEELTVCNAMLRVQKSKPKITSIKNPPQMTEQEIEGELRKSPLPEDSALREILNTLVDEKKVVERISSSSGLYYELIR